MVTMWFDTPAKGKSVKKDENNNNGKLKFWSDVMQSSIIDYKSIYGIHWAFLKNFKNWIMKKCWIAQLVNCDRSNKIMSNHTRANFIVK